MYKITSEIYQESRDLHHELNDGRVLTTFRFHNPNEDDDDKVYVNPKDGLARDKDGDLVVIRKRPRFNDKLLIEHHASTELRLVGLQVWRGALLLADYLFHLRDDLRQYQMLELGAGVGLTSIAAGIIGQNVVCTDVNLGGILDIIRINIKHNYNLLRGNVRVMEYDFKQPHEQHEAELLHVIDNSDLIVAADVIYDDTLTDALLEVLDYIFEREHHTQRAKQALIALEKRYVFTLSDLEAVPPMFDYFLRKLKHKTWQLEYIATDFPKFFDYKRCEQLVLFKLTSGRKFKLQQPHAY